MTQLLTTPCEGYGARPTSHLAASPLVIRLGPCTSLQVEVHSRPVVVTLQGDFDLASSPALAALLDWVLDVCPGRVVVDVSSVTFIDSYGVEPLLAAQQGSRGVVMRGSSRALDRLLTALAQLQRTAFCPSPVPGQAGGHGAGHLGDRAQCQLVPPSAGATDGRSPQRRTSLCGRARAGAPGRGDAVDGHGALMTGGHASWTSGRSDWPSG